MNEQTGIIRELAAGEQPRFDENRISVGMKMRIPGVGWFEIEGVNADANQVILKGIPKPKAKPYPGPPRNRAEKRRTARAKQKAKK